MTAACPPSPWPAPAPAGAVPWRFAREVVLPGQRRALQWVQQRNASLAPRQLLGVYLSLCALAALVAAGFWTHGAPFVGAFAGIEVLALGAALLTYARHARDCEILTLAGRSLAVEQHVGGRVARDEFPADWLAVEPAAGQGSLIQLSARGRSVRVGRHLRPELRAAFAQELRRALRRPAPPIRSDLE